ncbi:MAG: 4Fe-4S binding protein [Clostridiales Family XIII bacterium]|jgi:formate hydrogenlyase subunit 6/NADH:ubiquinone oxidoreductase subunit I|nr:4Fe-4S binding protein [Clostridiales Family XIII bacterium]
MPVLKIGKMVMGSLFKKPATLMYPVISREWQERTRGQIAIEMDACILCGICMRKCPTDAITVEKASRSWTIQRMQCIQCCCCVEVCPKKCLMNKPEYTTPDIKKISDRFEKPPEEPKPAPAEKPAPAAGEAKAAPAEGAAKPAGATKLEKPAPAPAE